MNFVSTILCFEDIRNWEMKNKLSDSEEYTMSNRYFDLDQLVEVELKASRDFLRVKETLTRMGFQQRNDEPEYSNKNVLRQVCYILFKQDKYYITHINELRKLDGDAVDVREEDVAVRNLIVTLLVDWNLVTVIDPKKIRFPVAGLNKVRVIAHKDKDDWDLISEYRIGKKTFC